MYVVVIEFEVIDGETEQEYHGPFKTLVDADTYKKSIKDGEDHFAVDGAYVNMWAQKLIAPNPAKARKDIEAFLELEHDDYA